MPRTFDFKKIKRLIKIYWVVQGFLLLLLVYMAMSFMSQFSVQGGQKLFLYSVLSSLSFQVIIFYPIYRFARREADNEINSTASDLTDDEKSSIRRKRLVGDVIKSGVFIFFLIFSYQAPGILFVQSVILFSFILTVLTYFQCYNFAAKRAMADKS